MTDYRDNMTRNENRKDILCKIYGLSEDAQKTKEAPVFPCTTDIVDMFYRELEQFPVNRYAKSIGHVEACKSPNCRQMVIQLISFFGKRGKYFRLVLDNQSEIINSVERNKIVSDLLEQVENAWRDA
jgi:hypothetical protein